jgi:hypothetical protein
MANAFLDVGVSGNGNFPTVSNGLYFTIGLGTSLWDNGVNPPFSVDQWIMNPDNSFLTTPGGPSGYTFFMDPQENGSQSGDGNTYCYAPTSGYKRGSTSSPLQAYAPTRTGFGISDYTLLNPTNGTAQVVATCVGRHLDGGGAADQAVSGAIVDTTITLTFASNASLTGGGGLNFNSLPTIAVTSSPCGTSGFTFSIADGALPAGLHLNSSTGAITGTPTESGPYAFTVSADKVSTSAYCWGSVDYEGYVWIGEGVMTIAGRSNGPISVSAVPRWAIHRFALKSRNEERS